MKTREKDGLNSDRLSKAFEVWYPTLESDLNKLRDVEREPHDSDGGQELQSPKAQEILEEILELSRINQKLIRNPDGSLGSNLEEISNMLRALLERTERAEDPLSVRRMRKFHPVVLDELMHMSLRGGDGFVGAQMALSLVRSHMPWVYDAGNETISILRSSIGYEEKEEALVQFRRIMEFSFDHPIFREVFGGSKEMYIFYRRLPETLTEILERRLRS